MLIQDVGRTSELEFVAIDQLVPEAHLVRKVARAVDFSFIREKVAHLYCADNGRPAIDPVVLFKMLFLGYLFGIRSERQLVREIEVNVAYRWFLGLSLKDKVPDASTLSQNRRRRFRESTIYQEIFDEIVLVAMKRRLVDGKTLYTDSTHLKANANKQKFTRETVAKSSRDYLDALELAIDEDRLEHGKTPMKPKVSEPPVKETKISTTDPESGYMVRDGKPKGFFYLDHRTVDGLHEIITDTFPTSAAVHDSIPYLSRLDRQRERFGLPVEAVGLDAGYFTAAICKGLEQRGIYGVIGYSRPVHRQGYLLKRDYRYHKLRDHYVCPAGETLTYTTTDRLGYRLYQSNPEKCKDCLLLDLCTQSATQTKIITRHVWQRSKERIGKHRLMERGRQIYARRKETVERSFADAKQLHGHRYAKMRGLLRVAEQCLLCAAAQNIKKIAMIAAKNPFKIVQNLIERLLLHLAPLILNLSPSPSTAKH